MTLSPIFIFGKGRSGTTWLAGQLCAHPRIAGVLNANQPRIKESRYFFYLDGRYGDLNVKSNFKEFVEVICATDYFRLAGADKEFLYSLPTRSYEEIFRIVMDEFAKRKGADHWLEKTPSHTRLLGKIAQYYPDAKFIAMIRDVQPVVASTLEFFSGGSFAVFWPSSRNLQIIRSVAEWAYYRKILESFARRSDQILLIRYEEFVADTETTLRQICEFIGVEYDLRLNEQVIRPNTSFRDSAHRKSALNAVERKLTWAVAFAFKFIPLSVMKLADKLWDKSQGRRSFPPSYFTLPDSFESDRSESESEKALA